MSRKQLRLIQTHGNYLKRQWEQSKDPAERKRLEENLQRLRKQYREELKK